MLEGNSDFTLEQAALARANKIGGFLQPQAKAKLDLAAGSLLAHLASDPEDIDAYALAQKEISIRFAQLSSEQSHLLSAYLLAEVVNILSDADELKKRLDGIDEMSEKDLLQLQTMMERKSYIELAISNIIWANATTLSTVVGNII